VRFRLRPADTSFYDLFARSADHLVSGAALLAEMLGEDNEHGAIATSMREAEHQADETTHEIAGEKHPFDDSAELGAALRRKHPTEENTARRRNS